jgi:hypothetical protein
MRKWNWNTKPMCSPRAGRRAHGVLAVRHELAPDPDLALVGLVEEAEEVQERRLAAAGRPDDRVDLPRLRLEGEPLKDVDPALVPP